MYGIIKNGAFFVAPNRITINGMTIVNPSNAQLESAGYFPVETTVPPASDGMVATPHYEQIGGEIVQSWTLEPVNPTPEEHLTKLEETKAEQVDVDELHEALDMILTGVVE